MILKVPLHVGYIIIADDDTTEYVTQKDSTSLSYGAALKADWSPRPLPQDDSYLEVTLVDFVAEGRIGVTYTAHVNAAKDGNGKDMQNLIGKQVVVKFAKPQFARSLAREAWFYECLEEAQRTAVAASYGFYTTPLDPTMNKDMLPWKQIKIEYKEALPSEDILLDDAQIGYFNGGRQYYSASQWLSWRTTQGTLAVLVLEKLGERYPLNEPEALKEEYR
ncbi:hypothetical protein ONZ45_g16835 [Pleurotus djamor]|nr:hypothetical protein ONZ45_g16835 [Pleurotus djamor]